MRPEHPERSHARPCKAVAEALEEVLQGFEAEALEEVLQGFEGAVLEADSVALLEALRGVVGV